MWLTDCAAGQRANGPILPVLEPGNFHAVAGRFAKRLASPENDVRTDQLFDQIQDSLVASYIEEDVISQYAFSAILLQVDAD